MKTSTRRRFLKTGLALAATIPSVVRSAEGEGLRIGLTAVILSDQAAFLSRWGSYLATRIGVAVSFVSRESYQEILDMMFAGKLDAAWICGYPYVLHEKRLRLLATPLYQGKPTYQSYLIHAVGANPPISGWTDLKGRVLAYSDPLSNSGWLVAQGQLRLAGLAPHDLKRTFFAHGHRNVAEAVSARLADAGAIDGYVWETMRRQGMPAIERTAVVWKSEPYGFPPIVSLRNGGHPKIGALHDALHGMIAGDEGRALLAALNLDGFAKGDPALFNGIRSLARFVLGPAGST